MPSRAGSGPCRWSGQGSPQGSGFWTELKANDLSVGIRMMKRNSSFKSRQEAGDQSSEECCGWTFFPSSVICFLAQSVSVTELRAVSPRQRPLSYDDLIAPIRDSPDSPIGPTLKVAEGGRTRLLCCSLVQTELREIWGRRTGLPNFNLPLAKGEPMRGRGWDVEHNVTFMAFAGGSGLES